MKTLEDRVKDVVVGNLGNRAKNLTSETSFINDLGMDSLETVELVMAFEKEFSVEIPEGAAEKITTIGATVEYLKSHGVSA